MAKSDPNYLLRLLPIIVGVLASCLFMVNRLLTANLTDSQARADALGVIVSAVLVLTGLLWQQVQPKLPEAVELIGEEGFELATDLPETAKTELAWASHLLLTNTSTKTLLIWYQNQVLLRRGILRANAQVKLGAIAQRAIEKQKAVYLVNLKLYPGRVEFDFLPENTQGIICQPLGQNGILILGANAPRSYTRQDEVWIAGIADKLANTLQQIQTINH
ncbi:MAG: cofactor assembly of complex C subunit B [Oculatellaceae cyanobacterium bins.114]|nr:cofactor assembly of complex C subunit B [Oculatellaceae cyanobacterium bins.114]